LKIVVQTTVHANNTYSRYTAHHTCFVQQIKLDCVTKAIKCNHTQGDSTGNV